MSEKLMSFTKDIQPCQKKRESQELSQSIKAQKKKIIVKVPEDIKFTKVIN